MSSVHITFDLDWCPDFMLEEVLQLLSQYKIKSTFFITHKTKLLNKIKTKHNLGIHPNFLGSSSLNKHLKIVNSLIQIVPNAKFIRTHALHMNTNLIYEIFKNFKSIKYDFSTLTYKSKYISEYNYYFNYEKINKINYNWEDSIAIHDKIKKWDKIVFFGNKNIYNFHPIHIFYNTKNFEHYLEIKKSIKNLNKLKLKDIDQTLINRGTGVKTFFLKLIKSNKISNSFL